MHIFRRVSNGTLSEIIGNESVIVDRIARTFGWERIAHKDLEVMAPETKADLEAYVSGINAYLSSNSYVQPIEFTLAGIDHTDNWSVKDVVTQSRFLSFMLSYGVSDINLYI